MSHASIEATDFIGALPRAITGGLIGTIVFTLMMKFLAPMMIGHPMDIAAVLGTFTGWALRSAWLCICCSARSASQSVFQLPALTRPVRCGCVV
jgi:hypothetical protein